jgi:hypothetical protein
MNISRNSSNSKIKQRNTRLIPCGDLPRLKVIAAEQDMKLITSMEKTLSRGNSYTASLCAVLMAEQQAARRHISEQSEAATEGTPVVTEHQVHPSVKESTMNNSNTSHCPTHLISSTIVAEENKKQPSSSCSALLLPRQTLSKMIIDSSYDADMGSKVRGIRQS